MKSSGQFFLCKKREKLKNINVSINGQENNHNFKYKKFITRTYMFMLQLVSKFLLQQQHMIELIRQRNIEDALDYAQSHLAERGEENPDILSELERTLALLAFEDPEKSPFGELLHLSQRQKV